MLQLQLLALALAGTVQAAGPERVAQLGLVPTDAVKREVSRAASDSWLPGLRVPRNPSVGIALDGGKKDDAGSTLLYSGTRSFPALGASQIVGGMLYPLSGNWFSTIETSVEAPSARPFRGYGLVGQVHRALPGGFDMSLGLHYNVSESGWSRQAHDPIALGTRAWSLYPPALSSSSTAGYELRLNYRYGERNTLGLTYGSGAESDYTRQFLGMQPGDSRQFGVTGEHWLTPDWALNYGVMASEQIGQHRGQGLRLGIRYRF
ncbi:MAG: hypothetical protein ACT4PS_14815 [Betaproteobacteria bacterium]